MKYQEIIDFVYFFQSTEKMLWSKKRYDEKISFWDIFIESWSKTLGQGRKSCIKLIQ